MRSAFLEFSNADGRTEVYRGTKRHIFVAVFPELTLTVTHWMYIAVDWYSQTDKVRVMFSVLLHSTFTAQILQRLYSLQLNSTYSNYTEAAATCSAAKQHSTFTVQIVQSATELYLQ